jgi:hypothetical protein
LIGTGLGQWQIWKTPSQGGDALQLTWQGGFAGFESWTAKSIYYAKTSSEPDIWMMQLEDGQEAAVLPPLHLILGIGQELTELMPLKCLDEEEPQRRYTVHGSAGRQLALSQ